MLPTTSGSLSFLSYVPHVQQNVIQNHLSMNKKTVLLIPLKPQKNTNMSLMEFSCYQFRFPSLTALQHLNAHPLATLNSCSELCTPLTHKTFSSLLGTNVIKQSCKKSASSTLTMQQSVHPLHFLSSQWFYDMEKTQIINLL